MLGLIRKGINLKKYKGVLNYNINKFFSPNEVWIPMLQHIGETAKPIVKKGDKVKKGQLIGISDKFISSLVHSSVSGEVKDVKEIAHPTANEKIEAVIIENDGKNDLDESILLNEKKDYNNINFNDIINMVKDAGIVGMGGAAFPSHVKLSPPKEKKLDSFILNVAECEPYLTCDAYLMMNKTESIIKGMKLAMKAIDVNKGYIGIEKKNKMIIPKLKQEIKKLNDYFIKADIEVVILPDVYPQGAEKQLINTVLKRQVPPKGLPYDVGVLVHNAATCYAIYEAVVFNKPLFERIITIDGYGVKFPGNYLVPVGTRIRDIIDFCGAGILEKVILGGPMMGLAQYSLDVPIVKGVSGVLFLKEDKNKQKDEVNCIKCSKCIDVCPMNLMPTNIAKLVKHEDWQLLSVYNIIDCMECGCCSFICPSNIPLVHLIKLGKINHEK